MVDFKKISENVKAKVSEKYRQFKENRAKDILEKEKEQQHFKEVAEQERIAERELTEKIRAEEKERSMLERENQIREQVRKEEEIKRRGGKLKVFGQEALSYVREKIEEGKQAEAHRQSLARSRHRRSRHRRMRMRRYGQ